MVFSSKIPWVKKYDLFFYKPENRHLPLSLFSLNINKNPMCVQTRSSKKRGGRKNQAFFPGKTWTREVSRREDDFFVTGKEYNREKS